MSRTAGMVPTRELIRLRAAARRAQRVATLSRLVLAMERDDVYAETVAALGFDPMTPLPA